MIDHIIPTSNLELIPPQIYTVLKNEFDNQVYEFSNTACQNVNFFSERTVPLDKSENPAIVIKTFKGDYTNQSIGSAHAQPYLFVLEIMCTGKNTALKKGYENSATRLLQLVSAVRYILQSPSYLQLGFAANFIEHTEVKGFQIYKDDRIADGEDIACAQLMFEVQCEETSAANAGVLLAQSDTSVFIELTEQGFQYQTISE